MNFIKLSNIFFWKLNSDAKIDKSFFYLQFSFLSIWNSYRFPIIMKKNNFFQKLHYHTLCVEWNKIAIRICMGGKPGVPPPWTPQIIVNIWDTIPKIFWGRNMSICWSGWPKILADYTSGRKYKRLKKKGEKWQLCFGPQIIAGNGQKISKHFWCMFRYTLHELKQIFWKMTKFDDF